MVKVNREIQRQVLSPSIEVFLEIRKQDWDRIKKSISRIPKPSKLLSNLYSLCFGASLTTFISGVFWVAIYFLISGFLLGFLDWKYSSKPKDKITEINEDMDEVDKLCNK